jgi:hypothetical protein
VQIYINAKVYQVLSGGAFWEFTSLGIEISSNSCLTFHPYLNSYQFSARSFIQLQVSLPFAEKNGNPIIFSILNKKPIKQWLYVNASIFT